ncbi:MAG: Gfo/Idh/MocA family oxidoreductase [Armatimonadetes bacterium]|nr:Gfo/Idh/MocA family oxidoreductase [Armatimonadota bacterium]
MDEIRVGMVGAGFAADFHTRCFQHTTGVPARVVAVTSQREISRNAFAERFGIPAVYESLAEMLDSEEIDVVDLCVPTYVHGEYIVQAAQAGRHVIVEKPLTGYTGELGVNDELIGETVPRRRMMDWVLEQCRMIEDALDDADIKLMYAENWVYAPALQKARRLIEAGGGVVLRMIAEESHNGSHASYAKYWRLAGGGSLLRTGSHPVGGVLYLKQAEGLARDGHPIRPKTVTAEVGNLTDNPIYQAEDPKFLNIDLADCEDWGTALITFEDGSVAEVTSSDVVLGGIYNHVQIFTSRGRIECNMNPNNQVMAYGPSEDAFGDEYLAEKISTRAGWNFASPDEHWASGYQHEIQDFCECIAQDRAPLSGWTLARDVVAVIYAAYVSAQEGRRVEVPLN